MANMKNKSKKTPDEIVQEIALKRWDFTLETQKSDRLDLHEVSVWELKAALLEAYERGKQSTRKNK